MDICLGTLNILPITDHKELVAQKVSDAIFNLLSAGQIGVAEIDPGLSDTVAFCEQYKIQPSQAANCVVLEAKRADKTWFAACIILGSTRADVNGLARRTLDAKKVSFANKEQAVAQTEMEYGAITPIGLPNDWPMLIDKEVVNSQYVVIGSGIRKSKLILPGSLLALLPNVQVLEGLGQCSMSVS
jgi:prolyl-tRNA editing enzyme YbaK/EbsC (Cys-tRNA(Pro) deacylase)